jgi:hypothetical protein
MYAVVDAFDRGIAPDIGGRPESLAAIRDRLQSMRSAQASHPVTPATGELQWFFMLGGTDESGADSGSGSAAPAAAIGRLMLVVTAILKNGPPSA